VVYNVLQAVETLGLPTVVAVPALTASSSLAIATQSAVTASSHLSFISPFISRFLKTAVTAQPATGQVAPEASAIAIQGVATVLETRTLVLVTLQNQILDILIPEQQRQLYQRIVWEVSHYHRYLQILARQRSQAPLQLPSNNPKVLPPIRLVRQMMAWVQTGPVAMALDWFQESTVVARLSNNLTANPIANAADPDSSSDSTLVTGILPIPPIPYEALAPLDRAIAQLEARTMPPALTELSAALEQRRQSLLSLLRAAVDYFFGDRHLGLSGTVNPSNQTQIAGDQMTHDRLVGGDYDWHPDPWLSYEDVFGQIGSVSGDRPPDSINALPEQPVTPPIALPSALQAPFSTARNWWTRLVGRFWQRDPGANVSAIVATPEATADLTPPLSPSPAIASLSNLDAKTTRAFSLRSPSSRSPMSADPLATANLAISGAELATRSEDYGDISNTWIEAEATTMGYVQHPLERILGWLDRAMLWLEEMVIRIGHWLQRLGGKQL
jgi:hypothetical protein